ncbi:hypothetical protein AMTR_s00008p00267160 [Amborella trichopoda]|uniref:Uncharacterized protein n=1 Tax=Amborella trichopoda TaxID=13333 RepID=W1NJS2_AMBTC|nr:hypothetical protein AMTR_s00008p00267160 [Amborella trichopoda]
MPPVSSCIVSSTHPAVHASTVSGMEREEIPYLGVPPSVSMAIPDSKLTIPVEVVRRQFQELERLGFEMATVDDLENTVAKAA